MGDWVEQAACQGKPVEMFYPTPPGRSLAARRAYATAVGEAKALCAGCPVRTFCRHEAVVYGEGGIWGGATEEERVLAGAHIDFLANAPTRRRVVQPNAAGMWPCPECGELKASAPGLGSHRRTHGVAGTSEATLAYHQAVSV